MSWPQPVAVFLIYTALLALSGASCSKKSQPGEGRPSVHSPQNTLAPLADQAPPVDLQIYVTGEIKGQLEPCGCTTEPLGDLARIVELVSQARTHQTPVLYLDAGSLLYADLPLKPTRQQQAALTAELLRSLMKNELKPAAIGLGPFDLAAGPEAITMPRHAANVTSSRIPLAKPEVLSAGAIKVGVFGVVSSSTLATLGVTTRDPSAAAKQAIADLRQRGAQVILALAHMTRAEAKSLVRATPGIDFVVAGQSLPEPNLLSQKPSRVDNTWIVQPSNRGQIVSKLGIRVRAKQPGTPRSGFVDAVGKHRAALEIHKLSTRIPELARKITQWEKDADADQSFLKQKRRELAKLKWQKKELARNPTQIPQTGNWFIFEQISIGKAMPCKVSVVKAKKELDHKVQMANLSTAQGMKAPAPAKGEPSYVGVEECSNCHLDAEEFWQTTKHFKAWETLTKLNKAFNQECIYCHVTGFDKPGGASLGFNEHLRDVQCETCHGPGSIHVDKEGQDHPRTLQRTPEATLCKSCHNPEHSNTFDYTAYLRDITGPGHGSGFRKKLSTGPTGAQLRAAGLKKAGNQLGAGCPK